MVEFVTRKSMKIRESGRSTDFISPSFGHGCLYNCTYCYMKRHKPDGLSIAKNTLEVLSAIQKHLYNLEYPKPSNQTHPIYWTYDISCNEDFALHLKHHNWQSIFDYAVHEEKVMFSFATKYCNETLLTYNPLGKVRVRMSLMPEIYRQKLEPNTSTINERILFIDKLQKAGYDVHINFSPVIVYPGALELYKELFESIDIMVTNQKNVLAEVIFLTHNKDKHQYNLDNNLPGEELIWRPEIQRTKKSQYGGENLRYEPKLKNQLIREFTALHDSIIPWNKIRYCFNLLLPLLLWIT